MASSPEHITQLLRCMKVTAGPGRLQPPCLSCRILQYQLQTFSQKLVVVHNLLIQDYNVLTQDTCFQTMIGTRIGHRHLVRQRYLLMCPSPLQGAAVPVHSDLERQLQQALMGQMGEDGQAGKRNNTPRLLLLLVQTLARRTMQMTGANGSWGLSVDAANKECMCI